MANEQDSSVWSTCHNNKNVTLLLPTHSHIHRFNIHTNDHQLSFIKLQAFPLKRSLFQHPMDRRRCDACATFNHFARVVASIFEDFSRQNYTSNPWPRVTNVLSGSLINTEHQHPTPPARIDRICPGVARVDIV